MCNCGKYKIESRSAWSDRVFAWAWSHATSPLEKAYGKLKDELFAGVHGHVVELGPGAGINLRHLPSDIRYIGVEPNLHMHPYLETAAAAQGVPVTLYGTAGEATGLPDACADFVISTLVLCSVESPEAVLHEVRRILKPGGKFIFIEHVAAERGTWFRTAQDFVQPLWKRLGDGCNPNRETATRLAESGFSSVHCTPCDIANPLILVRPHIVGYTIN